MLVRLRAGGRRGKVLATVSVIIPAFNAEVTLARTLDSVALQTRAPNEVVLVDDGSTDGTAELARAFASRIPMLRVISTPNRGVSEARNLAIEESSSEVIAPLDSDDIWHPTYLEKMVGRYEERGGAVGLVYAGFRLIGMDDRVVRTSSHYVTEGSAFYQMLLLNFVGNGSGMVFGRRQAIEVGLYDTARSGNEDYRLQLLLAWNHPVSGVAEYLVGYRDRPGSLSKRSHYMVSNHFKLLGELADLLPGIDRQALGWARAQIHDYYSYILIWHGRYSKVLAPWHNLMALAIDPVSYVRRPFSRLRDRFYVRRLRRRLEADGYHGHYENWAPTAGMILDGPLPMRIKESVALDRAKGRHRIAPAHSAPSVVVDQT